MSLFESLYDLSLRLLKAPPKSELGRLTLHHCHSHEEAKRLVETAVLQREMPSESPTSRWGILRVFMRNLVNRSQAPMTGAAMQQCLNQIGSRATDEASRTAALINAVADNYRLSQSLAAALEPGRAPDGSRDYLDWLADRIAEYQWMPVDQIDTDRVLSQLHNIASDRATKIPNMGIALASNLFADLGIRVVGKPDLHVMPTVQGLLGIDTLRPDRCIRELIRITKEDAPRVEASGRFDWLTGGLYPRDIDRMMYLIGSDNFHLGGSQLKRQAPRRRGLMLATLIDADSPTGATRMLGPAQTIEPPRAPPRLRTAAQRPQLAEVRMQDTTARQQFFDALGHVQAAHDLVGQLTKLCSALHAQVHHTRTQGGDLRVRADRPKPNPRQQNVIVMTWVPNRGYFSCKVPMTISQCSQLFPRGNGRVSPGLLSCRFNVYPGTDDEAFLFVVGQSIQRFRDGELVANP